MTENNDGYCPDNTLHVFKECEEWAWFEPEKRNVWYYWEECLKCGKKINTNGDGCKCSFDKQHNFKKNTYIDKNGIAITEKKCLNCGAFMSVPHV